MPDVEIAVGLGREAGVYAAAILVGLQIFENDVANKISRSIDGAARSCGGGFLIVGGCRHDGGTSIRGGEIAW